MVFNLSINTDNDAFAGDDKALELARILRGLADDIVSQINPTILRDINGNTVGHVVYEARY